MELKMIPVHQIQPNPFQPRESFEKESLQELADSIKDASIIQPIVVRRQGEGYQIIAGERRWRAAQMAGLKEIPCIIKEVSEGRVLLESLIENLHRKDLMDIERENAVHELWEKREALGFKTKAELARAIGVYSEKVEVDLEAWEFRHKEKGTIVPSVPTYILRATRGLETEERKHVIDKVATGEWEAKEVFVASKVLRRAPKPIKEEILKTKSRLTPKMAETIIEKLDEDEQSVVLEEIKRQRLTEDEVEARVMEIQRAKEMGVPLRKEMGVQEGTVYTVGEYECPHCKKHYLIKCDGKRDWVE